MSGPVRLHRALAVLPVLALLAIAPAPIGALGTAPCSDAAMEKSPRTGAWPAPLDAVVSFRTRGEGLRDAIDRLGTLSGIPLAYSSDLLPRDREVCVVAERQPLGRVLTALLSGTNVEAVVIAGRVVLAPVTGATPANAPRVSMLERVVVTGNAVAPAEPSLALGVDVIDGERLRREAGTSLASVLDAAVPGLWLWEQAPGSLTTHYGGMRGASSFATSYPKMYIDGVEVANPLLVTQLDPAVIDRIEVIRGPQGSALYGSGAISGVINVLTRHDGADASGARVQVTSIAGGSASAFGSSPVPVHDQRITMRTGTETRSAGLALQFGQTGAVIPGSHSRTMTVVADARTVAAGATLSASGRLFDKSVGVGRNPLLGTAAAVAIPPSEGGGIMSAAVGGDQTQAVRLYTLAGSAVLATNPRWTHTLVAGLDGYHLDHVADASTPFSTGTDSALRAARGSGDRATFRASSVARLGDSTLARSTVTLSLEHSVLRQSTPVALWLPAAPGQPAGLAIGGMATTWSHNSGAVAQASTSWRSLVHLTGGLRLERNDAFAGDDRYPLLPLVGAALTHSFGGVDVKLRSSYGKGIRAPRSAGRLDLAASPPARGATRGSAGLDPEVQTGIESGVELRAGDVSVQATRFDQRATGLIQNVLVGVDTLVHSGAATRSMRYQLENVGEIGNRGWELQGVLRRGALGLVGTFTAVDSRVITVSPGYLGDLRAGDRMLAVPARTGSLSARWSAPRWSASMTATRASDWVNYDRIALARAYAADGAQARDLMGRRLRAFWRGYDGQTHLHVGGSRELSRGVTLVIAGDNLLGGQLGEPDNLTIRAGRTLTGGLRAAF